MNSPKQSVLMDFQTSQSNAHHYWATLRAKIHGMYPVEMPTPSKSAALPWLLYHEKTLKDLPGDLSPQRVITQEASCFKGLELVNKDLWNQLPLGSKGDQESTLKDTAGVKVLFDKALETIERLWPQALLEFEKLIRGVVWISSRRTYSLSDPKLFGIIFLNADYYTDKSYAELATDIVHETAHHTLFVETSIDKLIPEDYKKPIFSPLRLEYRPAIGSLHAAFSLARMLRWGRILLDTDNTELQNEGQRLHTLYAQGFIGLIEALCDLSWSVRGKILLEDLRQESDVVKRHLGPIGL